MRKNMEDQAHDGSVRKWHAWRDKPGMPYAPMMWHNGTISTVYGSSLAYCSSLNELIDNVANRKLFVLCRDLLNEKDFSFSNELLGASASHPYLSRSGMISALRVSQKKQSGFLVPGTTWGIHGEIKAEHLRNIITIFELFGYQSTTPASLSEKVLRSTLPDIINFSRPSLSLRKDILENQVGGRIDVAQVGQFFKEVFEYDKNKAYLWHSREVPDPALAPLLRYLPSLDAALSYPAGYWLVFLRCHSTAIAPIQIDGRTPKEGERIERWLWSEELLACIEAGYEIERIQRGYGFRQMSNFMEQWSAILWANWEQSGDKDPMIRDIIKTMMVGLPGRFLKSPEFFSLIPLSEARPRTKGKDDADIPLRMHLGPDYEYGDRIISDYAMRPEYDRESTALSQVGAYIVMKMRMELYEMMRKEAANGRRIIRSYIDCYSLDGPSTLQDLLGPGLGQWKEKRYGPSWTEENRFIGVNLASGKIDTKAPGYEQGGEKREALMSFYQSRA
jgi:hypothetical protein